MNVTEELRRVTPERSAAREDVRALRKREWAVLGFLLVVSLVAFFNVKRIVVSGISMQPTFKSGQSVVVWTSIPRSSLHEGDIIVFRAPDGSDYIKRVVFIQNSSGTATIPGDLWTTDGPQPFAYIFGDSYHQKGVLSPLDRPVDDRRFWVLGDNYLHSEDSRDFGPIAPKSILGKVIM